MQINSYKKCSVINTTIAAAFDKLFHKHEKSNLIEDKKDVSKMT